MVRGFLFSGFANCAVNFAVGLSQSRRLFPYNGKLRFPNTGNNVAPPGLESGGGPDRQWDIGRNRPQDSDL
jgi:hypothetical protein